MAAYTSTQSGNFNDPATWCGGGWPNLDGDTFTVVAGNTVTYNVTTPLNTGLGSSVVSAGGTFIIDSNTRIRFDGATAFLFAVEGNLFVRSNTKILLKGTTAADKIFDVRSYTQRTTTATSGTAGQNTINVANPLGIIVGNKISGTGIGTNATVTQVAGNTLTLSVNNTSTVSGTITIGNTVEIVGSEGMPITNVSSAITTSEYQQGFISVVDATQFASNDWISIYKRDATDPLISRNDEGYIIHDIDANNIFLREFVGPTTTISAVSDNIITVENPKKFRTYQKLIFGTGANRNILSVNSINYITNTITLSANVIGSVVGQTVYTTGPIQAKSVNDRVRKVATTVAVQATSTNTQIVLSCVDGFNIDDEILIDARWPGDSSYTDERPEKRNITNIVGNTITLNASLGYIAYVGAFVVKLTRDIKIIGDYEYTLTLSSAQSLNAGDVITQAFSRARGVVKTSTVSSTTVVVQDNFGAFVTGSTNNPWISVNGTPLAGNVFVSSQTISTTQGHCQFALNRGNINTTNNLGSLRMRDIEFTTFSGQNSTSARFWLRGQWSSPVQAAGGVEFEGLTWSTPSQTDNFNLSTRRFNIQRYLNDATVRCCVCYNTEGGFWPEEGYNLQNLGIFNNYSARAETFCFIIQQLVGGAWEVAYNYAHRADDAAFWLATTRYSGRGFHHNWCNMAQGRGFQYDSSYGQGVVAFQNKFEGYFNPTIPSAGRSALMQYNEFLPVANFFDFAIDTGFQNHNFGVPFDAYLHSLEHNYEIDAETIYIPNGQRVWDSAESAWKCTFDDDAGAIETGFDETIWIPANTTVTVSGTIKLDPLFSGTAPKLELLDCNDRFYFGGSQSILSTNHPLVGFRVNANFNASILNNYQSVTITSPPKSFGRYVTVGIISTNSNAFRGWWEKPLEVVYSTLPDTPEIQMGIRTRSITLNLTNDASLNERKIRLGGRLN